jgi:hypothetical protein
MAVAANPVGTEGGALSVVELLTVTLTAALVEIRPDVSEATARSECDPLLVAVVFQEKV